MRGGGNTSVPHLRRDQINRSLQFGAILEGLAHLLAQDAVGEVDGIEDDGLF